jgi:very-short-patch-repair endonuclease
VRSVELGDLSEADRLRRGLIAHFARPFAEQPPEAAAARELCESPLEREVYDWLAERGYRVRPQVRVGNYRIDLVVEGGNHARLAIECDGDKYHGPEKWTADVRRQRVLERVGWSFWRCFASTFVRRREAVLEDLAAAIAARGIQPIALQTAAPVAYAEKRPVRVLQAVS